MPSTDPNDPKIVGYTIIDAEEDGSVVTFENGETAAAVLTLKVFSRSIPVPQFSATTSAAIELRSSE